jgi:hypothetical protein
MARVPPTTRRRKGELLIGLEVVRDDWDKETKNAVAIRNATWIDGQCPHCGAERKLTAYLELSMVGVSFIHADDCPVTELLDPRNREHATTN